MRVNNDDLKWLFRFTILLLVTTALVLWSLYDFVENVLDIDL